MPRKPDGQSTPSWISRTDLSDDELRNLKRLDKQLDREYPLEAKREQLRRLLVLLGTPRANFDRLQTDRGASPPRVREAWFRAIERWKENSLQHFPGYVQLYVNGLHLAAAGYAVNGEVFDRPAVRDFVSRIWKFLDEYERLLRLKIVESGLPPPSARKAGPIFPTPAGAEWKDIRIRFKDRHTVSVKAGNEAARTYHYSQMGMDNRKNGSPTVRWELLEKFADGHGEIGWRHRSTDSKISAQRAAEGPSEFVWTRNEELKIKKRVQTLGADLKRFFGLEEYPFEQIWERKKSTSERKCVGWKSKFRIEPEGGDGQ